MLEAIVLLLGVSTCALILIAFWGSTCSGCAVAEDKVVVLTRTVAASSVGTRSPRAPEETHPRPTVNQRLTMNRYHSLASGW